MKKIICLVVAVMLIALFTPVIYAEDEVIENESVPETDIESESIEDNGEAETEQPAIETEPAKVEAENQTLTGRLWQYVSENKTTVISTTLDIVLIVLYYLAKKTKSKKDDIIVENLQNIRNNASVAANGQTNMTQAVNGMIQGYNDMTAKYEEQESNEESRNQISAAVLATNMTILEILQTVYKGSKNLPQGTKDLIDYKYAKCLQELENNEQMKALVNLVKTAIDTPDQEEDI